jgi:glycoside hydrolase-like protein
LPNTGNCGGLNGNEIAAAHVLHMGILPIYNDYDCSAVSGNAAGAAYAEAAVWWLQNDLIPQGTVIAIDIEPVGAACPGAGNVDMGFIAGWYDVLMKAGYWPAYYGDTAPGSAFANAWCTTTQARPDIANNSYLWSFEPSLSAVYGKGNAPAFSPYSTTCPGHYAAWQYLLSAGSTPDVDQDEANSSLPLWYP